MPVLPPAPLGIRVIFKGTYQGSNWANIMYVQYSTGTPTVADLNTLAASIGSNYRTNVMVNSVVTCHLTSVTLVDINTDSGNAGVDLTDRTGPVALTGMPVQVCQVLSWKIARRYRGGHPRSYIAGISDSQRADFRTWSVASKNALAAGGLAFITAVNALSSASTGQLTLGTYSYYHGVDPVTHKPILRTTPLFQKYIGTGVDGRIDTQRRRLGKPVP